MTLRIRYNKITLIEMIKHKAEVFFCQRDFQYDLNQIDCLYILKNTDSIIKAKIEHGEQSMIVESLKLFRSKNSDLREKIAFVKKNLWKKKDSGLVFPLLVIENDNFLSFMYNEMKVLDRGCCSSEENWVKVIEEVAKTIARCIRLIHSDNKLLLCIKPKNIMIDNSAVIRLRHRAIYELMEGLYESADYLPPEYMNKSEIGKATDFWQFGVTL